MNAALTWLSIVFVALPWGIGIGLGIVLVLWLALRIVTWWSNRGWKDPPKEGEKDA
ncbi:MAG: hypothetical protein BWX54_01964 [Verrucomicrobia bacterium ADurb.Bin018]|nr:MAG: hypothetical protein BWX54_01964 [Verrucomicrobia bacterium ADurb.Bin018]